MDKALPLAFLFALSIANADDTTRPHQKTSVSLDARYEIVQSPLKGALLLRLDKITGTVHQIVTTKGDDLVWEEIPRRSHPQDRRTEGKVSYQIFTSGLAVKFTYLINVNSGATWVLVETKDHDLIWSPIL